MSDDITLPREVVKLALEALEYAKRVYGGYSKEAKALRAALAAEQPKPEPVACLVGMRGSAFDLPTTRRAYTYVEQPGNGPAWRLGVACNAGASQSAGDCIDRGLALLQELQNQGFGVFELGAEYTVPSAKPTAEESSIVEEALRRENERLREELAEANAVRERCNERAFRLESEIERLQIDAERYRKLKDWMFRQCLLRLERVRIDTPESFGDWVIFRKPYSVDGTSLLGYGATEDAAIDEAMKHLAPQGETAIWLALHDPRG